MSEWKCVILKMYSRVDLSLLPLKLNSSSLLLQVSYQFKCFCGLRKESYGDWTKAPITAIKLEPVSFFSSEVIFY
ncbi:uncharacterized protein LOC104895526 [Beta vulgaris subsp. vulgaris]|uniref:uncharacterized protein LOC104895526 n=1 Tax=Beta vulgaris subsp. vulgaris TaxID=3555 RepID=UPI0020366F9C|nr:uncharacterized protein LOC104895526 [Beta vulgaris subsp. vulgaris]